jgi:hypothetical protein
MATIPLRAVMTPSLAVSAAGLAALALALARGLTAGGGALVRDVGDGRGGSVSLTPSLPPGGVCVAAQDTTPTSVIMTQRKPPTLTDSLRLDDGREEQISHAAGCSMISASVGDLHR